MEAERDLHIDFEPSEILDIIDLEGEVVVVLPLQPCYSESTNPDGRADPEGIIAALANWLQSRFLQWQQACLTLSCQ